MSLQHLIITHGYLAVFVLMAVESACIPVPSEVVMLCGGALAAQSAAGSHPKLVLIMAAGCLGNVVGGYVAWALGRRGGHTLLERCSGRRWAHGTAIHRAERWFARYGAAAVMVGRLMPGVGTFISLPAGVAGMPALPFGLYSLIGCLPWSAALAGAGYRIGCDWPTLQDRMHGFGVYLWTVAAVVLVAASALAIWRRRSTARAVAK